MFCRKTIENSCINGGSKYGLVGVIAGYNSGVTISANNEVKDSAVIWDSKKEIKTQLEAIYMFIDKLNMLPKENKKPSLKKLNTLAEEEQDALIAEMMRAK